MNFPCQKYFIFFFWVAVSFADSIPELKPDTVTQPHPQTDSSYVLIDTTEGSDSLITQIPESTTVQPGAIPLNPEIPPQDSIRPSTGFFFGFGAGVTLGNLPLLPLWKASLPDSLSKFGLQDKSFAIFPDTSIADSLQFADTAKLAFRIKELPSAYNMTFPFRISAARLNDNSFLKASLLYSLISKNQKSIVYAVDDTLKRRIDLKQKLLLHSVSLEVNYGIKIPPQYFSIESIEKSYFFVGLGVSPLLYLKCVSDIENKSEDNRLALVENSIKESIKNQSAFGTTFSFKTGLSAVRRLSSNGIAEINICYSLSWFDYFYSNGKRLQKRDISGKDEEKKELSFLSNRFEIGVSLYKRAERKK